MLPGVLYGRPLCLKNSLLRDLAVRRQWVSNSASDSMAAWMAMALKQRDISAMALKQRDMSDVALKGELQR